MAFYFGSRRRLMIIAVCKRENPRVKRMMATRKEQIVLTVPHLNVSQWAVFPTRSRRQKHASWLQCSGGRGSRREGGGKPRCRNARKFGVPKRPNGARDASESENAIGLGLPIHTDHTTLIFLTRFLTTRPPTVALGQRGRQAG